MQQAPFDVRRDGVLIRTYSLAFSVPNWKMKSSEPVTGVPLSLPWVQDLQRTNLLGDGTLTTSIVLFLRNQSDYSNVLIVLGTHSVIPEQPHITPEMSIQYLLEYLFDIGEEYLKENNIKGDNDEYFITPSPFNYGKDYVKAKIIDMMLK
ncbi:MAG TPA: hypothetical protein VFN30_10700 [Chitinophagaceae bacterium]|nr:hypothetical protein [Chitinophagaceae bacterium]